jgi:hypothetical protein
MIGAWLDTEDIATNPDGGDSPRLYNSRLGTNAPMFELEQQIPLQKDQFGFEMTGNITLIQVGILTVADV